MYYSDEEAKRLICEYGKRVYRRGMVAGNEGNISCRVGAEAVWVTPTGESKGYLTEDMLTKTDLDGNILIAGNRKPTSEAKLHYRVYRESGETMAVFHTHASFATAYACSRKKPNTKMLPELLGLFGEEIPLAPYGKPGTFELPESVAPFVRKNRAVLLQNHGALTWGPDVKQAYFYMEFLESCCKTAAIANFLIGEAGEIPDKDSIQEMLDGFRQEMRFETGGRPE